MLLNLPRARAVMAERGLDALVAAHRINIYYLTDFWGALQRIDRSWSCYAVLPRDPDAPAALVVGLAELHLLDRRPTWVPNVITYARSRAEGGAGKADSGPPELYPHRAGLPLTQTEQAWTRIIDNQAGKYQASALLALKRALTDAGLSKARIGTDDPRLIGWLQGSGLDGLTGVDAVTAFRQIRMVKTPDEIALLKRAAEINVEAIETVVGAVHEGATVEEMELVFNTAWAQRGGQALYILLGSAGGLRHGKVTKGDPFMVDALGTYRGYHGDTGRTVVVGEPPAEVRKAAAALKKGWETACAAAKPGVSVPDLLTLATATVNREGFSQYHRAVAHSVGLEHTDNPVTYGIEAPPPNFMLAENMVLSLDMPHHEFGFGHLHLEDSILIGNQGATVLAPMKQDLIVK